MNPLKTRISFFIIFLLFASIANVLKANDYSGYNPECSISDYTNPLNEQAPAAISATMTGPTSVCLNSLNQNITFTGYNGSLPYTFIYKLDGISQSIKTTGAKSWVLLPINTTNVNVYTFELDSVIDSANKRQVQSGTVKVLVKTIPAFDFSFIDNQCLGTGVLFAPTLTGNYSYLWDFGDGITSSEINPKHVFSVYGTGTKSCSVKLIITDNSTSCQDSITKSMLINKLPDATLNGTGSGVTFNDIPAFRICNNSPSVFNFTNGSSTSSSNLHYIINWGDGTPDFDNTSFTTTSHSYQIGLWNLTYTVEGTNSCKNIKPYIVFVGSNPAVSMGSPGNTDVCISQSLTFPITGTNNNPSGTIYTITFNDGSAPIVYNHPAPNQVSHTFLKSSCGSQSSDGSTNYPNSFYAKIVATNPCGTSAVSVVPIYVSTPPVADFTMAATTGCTDTPICLSNASTNANEISNGICSTKAKVIWSISPSAGITIGNGNFGNDFGSADPGTWTTGDDNICPVFTNPGTYTITMKAWNRCDVVEKIKTICIEAPIVPQFTVDATQGCIPLNVITTNNTVLPANPCNPSVYRWSVSYIANYCGVTPGYTYTGGTSFSSISPSFQFTNPGVYKIQLAVTNNCGTNTTVQTVTVTKPPTVTINPITDKCGAASFIPVAAVNSCAPITGTLTYAWSFPGGSPSNSTSLNPGTITYNVTGTYTVSLVVTNDCGIPITATKTFNVKSVPVITNTVLSQTICSGHITDLVTLVADLSNVTFSWTATSSTGITGFIGSGTTGTLPAMTLLNLTNSPGMVTYSITPTLNGCVGNVVNYVVTVNPSPTITLQPQSSQVCQGGTASLLTIGFTGLGTPSYQWYKNMVNDTTSGTAIPGEINATFNPPTATVDTMYYYCAITFSGGGCSNLITNTASVGVNAMPVIKTQPIPSQMVCVGGTTAFPLSFVYTGGAGVVSFQWYSTSANITTGGAIIPGATNKNYSPPAFTTPGTYYYYAEISFRGSGCGLILTDTAKIVVIADPIVTMHPLSTQTLCQNTVPAGLSVVASGGIEVFSYQWYSNLINNTTTGTKITNAVNSAFTPPTTTVGTTYFYCVVSQPNGPGCVVTSNTSEIIVTTAPSFQKHPASSTVCLGVLPDVLSVITVNGTGTPTYQWYSNSKDSLAGGIAIPGATGSSYIAPSGTIGTMYYYCVAGFASVGCSGMTSNIAQVTVNANPVISNYSDVINSGETFSVKPDNLNGDIVPVGTIYTWTIQGISPVGSIGGASSQLIPQTIISQTLTNVTTSIATVTYTATPNSSTCKGANFNVIVTVNPPLNPNITIKNISCFGMNDGSIKTAIQGGVPFKTGNPYTVSWTGPNGFSSAVNPIENLKSGNYNLSITDSVGMVFTNKYTITEPADITIQTITNKNISCFGASNGEIAIEVTGGTQPYVYNWLKDAVPFAGTKSLTNLGPGMYTVTVSDKNLCGPKTASFDITQPTEIVVTIDKKVNVTCFGYSTGSLSVGITGGVPVESTPGVFVYTYSWTGPNGFVSSAKDLINLVAGNYHLIVTDNTGCTVNFSATITQPDELKLNQVITPVTCYGENNASIKLNITGGYPPYQIEWSNLGKGTFQDNLSPGTYTVQVTDSTGCYLSNDIVIDEAAFSIQPTVKQITCFGVHNGSIILNIRGGIKPLKLTWSDNPTAGTIRNQLGPGTYTVVITDASACIITKSFTIIEPPKLKLSAGITNAFDCNNPNSGAINLTVTGGTEPYSCLWTNGKTSKDLSAIQGGKYGVTVTDANGCSADTLIEIIRPLPITLSVKTVPGFDCLTHVVKEVCTAAALGGIPPYQFNWSNGTTTGLSNEFMETTQSGIVILGVTDSRNCPASYTFNLSVPVPGIQSRILNCDAHVIGFTAIIPTGLDGDYTYSWDFGDGKTDNVQNPLHTYDTPGTYKVSLILKNAACSSVYNVTIQVESAPVLVLDKLPVFCTGDSLSVHVSGAETYRWSDGSAGDSFLIKQAGDYLVTGTSKQGCTSTLRFTSTNFEPFNYTIQSDRNEVTTQNSTLQLWSESISYSDYFWDFGDSIQDKGNNQLHTYTILKDGYYDIKLKVKNPNGCMEYATKRIWITDASMGNVFSPGYDGVFLKGFHIQLYNRNGFLLYDGSGGWDGNYKGTPVSNDTYFYVIYLSGESGIKTKTGFVTVVR